VAIAPAGRLCSGHIFLADSYQPAFSGSGQLSTMHPISFAQKRQSGMPLYNLMFLCPPQKAQAVRCFFKIMERPSVKMSSVLSCPISKLSRISFGKTIRPSPSGFLDTPVYFMIFSFLQYGLLEHGGNSSICSQVSDFSSFFVSVFGGFGAVVMQAQGGGVNRF